jgi:two-component system NtrC family sensor kinase
LKVSQRWLILYPYVLAIAVVVLIGWSVLRVLAYPDDGIKGTQESGLITQISPNSPAYGILRAGDLIVSVDGVPFQQAFPFYPKKHAGDEVQIVIKRGGQLLPVTIYLVKPSLDKTLEWLVPLFVALIFCLVGVGVQTFAPVSRETQLFFLFSQASALLLCTGQISVMVPSWDSTIFNYLLWPIGPLAVHFHLHFPQRTSLRGQRFFIPILYSIAVLAGLPYLIFSPSVLYASSWYPQYRAAKLLFLVINLLMVVALLVHDYRFASTPGVRGKIRIVVLGGVLSALPLVALTLLPDILLQETVMPYPLAIFMMSILPLTYGYAIFRHRLIEIEKHINRGATYILVYSILGSFYMFLYFILHHWLQWTTEQEPLMNTLLVVVLASLLIPLSRRMQRIVDTVFYGGWYDYRSAITQITQGLEQITDLKVLARVISERLVFTLRLQETCVFLRDVHGDFSVIEVEPKPKTGETTNQTYPTLPRSSLKYLLNMGDAIERTALVKQLSDLIITPEEHQLLDSEQVYLWVPIIGRGQVQGLLALGPKFGGDIFSDEDVDILRVVSRQIGPIMENIHLLTQLRQHAAQLEQRVAERTAELHDAKERVEAILAGVGDGVFVTDLQSNILTVNAAFEEMTGYRAAAVVGQKIDRLYPPDNDHNQLADMRLTLQNGVAWGGELIMQRKNRSQFDVQLTIAPVRNQSGKIVSYVGSQRDITRQRDLDRLKDHFISDVSHELRTPATNLVLYLELLERATPEKRIEYQNVLLGQSRLLMTLIDDILDLSRLTIGKSKKIEMAAVDLNLLAEQVVTAHLPLAEVSELRLIFDPCPDLPPVRGEQNQLARLITNLVSNAIRYTPQGQVCVRTYLADGQACLEVQDTGIGIDPEDQPHLFERFYRGRQVRQSKIHGTGLGLAIVKEIVDMHGGCVTIQSQLGNGSTFQTWLPLYKDSE